ncbi:MAG: hypothetical protein CVU44_01805 [Chloroflexi bacterium HGW-Chloroflexi-6]|nr:MAG: hypothetical protein CVU44_01805 [Chloroflexi bacterium HGW-Chloroflexi-6]
MSTLEEFTLALRAYQQVQAEIGNPPPVGGQIFPSPGNGIEPAGPLPSHSVVFGIAGDGLPLILRLDRPASGPILLMADKGSGKTAFLQTLARSTRRLNPVEETAILALTDFPDEWQLSDMPGRTLRVHPAYQESTADLLLRLADWVTGNQQQRSILLLIDGLDSILHLDDNAQQAFAFLLENGPRARLWPVVSVNSARAQKLPDWLAFFQTRIYGRIVNPQACEELTHLPGAPLGSLFAGAEFCMRHQSRWMRFWLPSN